MYHKVNTIHPQRDPPCGFYGRLTGRQLEGHGEAVVGPCPLGPLQLGVERVQHVELHGLEEAVALVLEDDRHHHLAAVLQVPLDVAHLSVGGGENNSTTGLFFLAATESPNE